MNIDCWFNDWVAVFGKKRCTNFTHMLLSSHVMLRYMQEWKCLHRFSQQGWEALNALIKTYSFRRTNRGGLAKHSKQTTKHSKQTSKLLGIARWLQRRVMCYSAYGDALFIDEYDDDDSSCQETDSIDTSTDTEESDNDDDESNFESQSSGDDDCLGCDDNEEHYLRQPLV